MTPIKDAGPPRGPAKSTGRLSAKAQSRKDNKERPVFYTLPGAKGQAVALWLNQSLVNRADGHPLFDGMIDGLGVNLWPRVSAQSGNFLAVFSAAGEKGGALKQLGTANVVVTLQGKVRFNVRLYVQKERIWTSVLKETPEHVLILCGFQPELLVQRRAAAEALKKNTENSEKTGNAIDGSGEKAEKQ